MEGKLGQTKIDAAKKQGCYDKKNGIGKTELKCVFSINEQNMGSQRMARARFDATNLKLCRIPPGSLLGMTVRDAVMYEKDGLPFCTQTLRYTLNYDNDECENFGGGAYVRSLASSTFLNDMESGATRVLEGQGFFQPNLQQHPSEQFQGSLGPIFDAEAMVANELHAFFFHSGIFAHEMLERVAKGVHQPTA